MLLGEALARCPELVLLPGNPVRVQELWESSLQALESVGAAVETGEHEGDEGDGGRRTGPALHAAPGPALHAGPGAGLLRDRRAERPARHARGDDRGGAPGARTPRSHRPRAGALLCAGRGAGGAFAPRAGDRARTPSRGAALAGGAVGRSARLPRAHGSSARAAQAARRADARRAGEARPRRADRPLRGARRPRPPAGLRRGHPAAPAPPARAAGGVDGRRRRRQRRRAEAGAGGVGESRVGPLCAPRADAACRDALGTARLGRELERARRLPRAGLRSRSASCWRSRCGSSCFPRRPPRCGWPWRASAPRRASRGCCSTRAGARACRGWAMPSRRCARSPDATRRCVRSASIRTRVCLSGASCWRRWRTDEERTARGQDARVHRGRD